MIKDEEQVAQIKENYTRASLSLDDRAMLDYVARLTLTPAAVTGDDVQLLREAGFGERAILDIAQVTAYFAFVTRLASGLGVTLE